MPPTDRLKLLNGWTNRPEGLNPREPVRLFGLHEPPAPTDLAAYRVYLFTELLRRLLTQQGRRWQMASDLQQADLAVGLDLAKGRGLWVRVTPPVGEPQSGSEAGEVRYLLWSLPPSGAIQWSAGSLAGAKAALTRLKDYVARLKTAPSAPPSEEIKTWRERFISQLLDDLNTPRALAVLWTMLQSPLPDGAKYALLTEFGRLLALEDALDLPKEKPVQAAPPRDWQKKPKPSPVSGLEAGKSKAGGLAAAAAPESTGPRRIIQSRDVRSWLDAPDRFDFTVSLVAYQNLPQLRTTIESLLYYIPRSPRSVEIVVAEMHADDETADYLATKAAQVANFRVVYARQNLGEAAGRNIAFRQARGRFLLLLDAGIELKSDLFEALWPELTASDEPALYGGAALSVARQPDATPTGFERTATPTETPDALDGTLLALPRRVVDTVGFMDEHFRIPYALDLDYSFIFRDQGLPLRILPPLTELLQSAPPARPTYGLSPEQVQRQQERNWQLFLRSWVE